MGVNKQSKLFVFSILLLIVAAIILIIGIALASRSKECQTTESNDKKSASGTIKDLDQYCAPSDEASRIKLFEMLERIRASYYLHYPNQVGYQNHLTTDQVIEEVKNKYVPYDPRPEILKAKTDASLKLLGELNALKYDKQKLKPNEYKSLLEAKLMLETNFNTPYDENFYNGDWMLGPNYFCWQPICGIHYDLGAIGSLWKPLNADDLKKIIQLIVDHKKTIDSYIANMILGVESGMVRTAIDCKAGLHAFGEKMPEISINRNPEGAFKGFYSKQFLSDAFYINITAAATQSWIKENGNTPKESIKAAILEGFARPVIKLLDYLEFNHSVHCLPNDLSSGLGNLPVDYIYVNGTADVNRKTTKVLPITSEPLDGRKAYANIIKFFLTTDITPTDVFEEGQRQLDSFYSQVIEIAKNVTGESSESDAITNFRKILDGDDQWHGDLVFPANESDSNAYKTCTSPETAAKYCPARWRSIQIWNNYMRRVMALLHPKITNNFYFTGEKNSVPNCPIEMLPHYNPSNGAFFFQSTDSKCTKPAYFGMPFFLNKYGPKFQEWSVNGHEARPGHHTQLQGYYEHFRNPCGGIGKWFSDLGYYVVFTEGWGLYSENPVLSDDTDLYKDNIMQKYGMIKWQLWRAVRLIVDSGLHFRGENRTWALQQFEKFAWDTTDFAVKEVTRYMSDPGQALAYMVGRLELIKMRKKAVAKLGEKFNLKEFHFQVLSQGSGPIDYLKNHIDRYIDCTQDSSLPMCEYILTPLKSVPKGSFASSAAASHQQDMGNRPMKAPHRHFI